MEGRILNRSLLAKVADFLNLEGVKRFPPVLDTDNIKAVFDIGRFMDSVVPAAPPALPTFYQNANHTGNLPANTVSVGVPLVGAAAVASVVVANDQGNTPFSATTEARILSINSSVGYTAAGAAADAAINAPLIAMIQLFDPGGIGIAFPIQETFAIVENVSPYSYTWTFPAGRRFAAAAAATNQIQGATSGWDGYVPPGWRCAFHITRIGGGGFFPALTSVDTYFNVATRPASGDWKP